jgi:hypothetical protein
MYDMLDNIVRTFVNATMYPHNNKKKKIVRIEKKP